MKDWPDYVLFFVGVGGAVALAVAASLGLKLSDNPLAYSGVGAILTYVLTQSRLLRRHSEEKKDATNKPEKVDSGHD